ncbi:pimeloyl-ACP methyl ester carboxylesterase [Albidovulum inexpectatum]|uniref:Pimeloyl-ACP methyl ester carboxylesterase n=1 Tax=Albidovulum inexpectatum TaxID=196587 RepID=A0A2S5JKC9_9RHOB|nr:alpha/beta fold hydrolase [Albidovulum inexpectatum]PPB81851.1 pimeloyl-ACP methyl ester carboxylesterase [Albidovulum inexpectatum]
MLNFDEYGATNPGTPIMIVHGLFGSARNWGAIARRLASDHRVIVPDMRNHGRSFHADTHRYEDLAADLAELIEHVGVPVDLVGHSMGGKAAMQLVLTRPDLLRRLVVADIAPVGYGHSQSHLIRAMRNLDLNGLTLRSEADKRLAADIESPQVRAFLLQSLDLKSDPPRWLLNLDVLDREMQHITGWPGTQGRFEKPTLFLAGANSDYVLPQHRDTIKDLFPHAVIARIADAGHWLHAEKPREFEDAVRTFLSTASV